MISRSSISSNQRPRSFLRRAMDKMWPKPPPRAVTH